ncbi:MAG: GMC family oxidoreductase [Nitrospirales bacterium]|nr:GMC family oxidoreductase [Nitrospirales bacterium]
MSKTYKADVIIVGAGVAGSLTAWKLAQQKFRVLVLESGPRVDRKQAVAVYRGTMDKSPESPYSAIPHAPRPETRNLQSYYVQSGPDLFKSTYERRVGGTTWHWLGETPRFMPNDFYLHSTYGRGIDWPLNYEDLESWYNEAEQHLGVSGERYPHSSIPRTSSYPLPPIPGTYLDRQVALAAQRVGIAVELTPQARNSLTYDSRPPCCGSASCIPICPVGAKYDASVHAKKAEELGVQILDNAVASFVRIDSKGQVSGIQFVRDDGSRHWATGRLYVIAAHAIETPKLLLMSRTASLPNGVSNSSNQVGRNLMDHPIQLSWALADDPLYPYRGPLATSGIEQFRDGTYRREHGAYRIKISNEGWAWPVGDPSHTALQYIQQGIRGRALVDALNYRVSRELHLASLVEQLPHPDNRITPAFDLLDSVGMPRPKIHWQVGDYTLKGMAQSQEVHEKIFKALGTSERHHSNSYEGAGHIMGTYRMGMDAKESVVDPNLRSHDHPNLFLLGSGVFPTSGTANPTLTIAALSLRTAQVIAKNLFP